jgi:hypothetical protein
MESFWLATSERPELPRSKKYDLRGLPSEDDQDPVRPDGENTLRETPEIVGAHGAASQFQV